MEYNKQTIILFYKELKQMKKINLKITIIENFSEHFEKPPKLKRLAN